ncbi:TonB-dependent receptor [Janthinobacterium fluminis]|uniref:TonB-dependent receptor n=1 Tax=Janthinobacterium fluminis TaxID=2987524 RepID=A0ABT5K046_9BURK|nr:TonB-dependent receptor [Janthinobacterium fluminis]MDC8758348.1 TonB-dependent receptor [Janthinobacterium fluminis]
MNVVFKEFNKLKSKTMPQAIRLAFCTAVAVPLAMPTAQAQQEGSDSVMQRVEITGSNIRRTDKETPSPVQILTVQELKASGYTTVSEVLRNITANGAGTLSQSFSGAFSGGASGISLRGLTVGATLVLIDGHRMAPYALSDDGQRSFVDISQIPFEAIERIEVLKDGASSIYGSDAMAGVVNVILKKRYAGAEISAEGGTSGHSDGKTAHLSGIYGWGDLEKDGRNAYIALEYRKQNKILLRDRKGDFTRTDWSTYRYGPGNALMGNNLTRGVPNDANGGLPGSSTGYLRDMIGSNQLTFLPGCTGAQMLASQCTYRDEDLEIQPETKNLNLMASYTQKLGEHWEMNLKGSVFQSDASQVGSHSASRGLSALAFGPNMLPRLRPDNAPVAITVPATYPGNTTGTRQYLHYNFPELGGRRSQIDAQTVRLVAELNGSWSGWDINASIGHTENTVKQTNDGYFNIENLQAAFNDPLHPYRVGAAASGNTAEQRAFIAPTQRAKAKDILQFVNLRGSRELLQLDGGPLAIGIGTEFTHRELDARAPEGVANGSQVGNTAWAIGKQNISAAYLELVAPVLKTLELDAAVRFDKVSGSSRSTTPKLGFKFSPLKEVALRGTYAEGFRAPNPAESGNTGSYFFASASRDPILCANDGPKDSDPATIPGNYPQQCAVQVGGVQLPGKDLKPEKSKSYTLGLILEPFKNFSASIDYYNIRVNNQIISANSDPNYDAAPFVVRGTPTSQPFVLPDGSIGTATPAIGDRIFSPYPYENALFTKTSGIDLDARWSFSLPNAAKVTAELNHTHMLSYKQGTAGGAAIELAGTHGPSGTSGDTGNPRDRAQIKLSYEQGPVKVSGTVNWVSSYSVVDPSTTSALTCDAAITNGSGAFNTAPAEFCSVKHFTTLDLFAKYQYSKQLSFHAAILNVFDAKPPLDFQTYGGAASSFYNPALHQAGAVGRFFNVGATYKF